MGAEVGGGFATFPNPPENHSPAPVGVLALQGAYREHISVFVALGVATREVRLPQHLRGLSGLVIPGGESTTMGLLAREYGLVGPLREFGRNRARWGTCAGAILLSRHQEGEEESKALTRLGFMDMDVQRNALGRQVDSFRMDLRIPALDPFGKGDAPFPSLFIRAPVFTRLNPGGVEVLATLEGGQVVAARQGRHLATAFHPELTEDTRFHRFFLGILGT